MTPKKMAQILASAFNNTRAWSVEEIEALLQSKSVFLVTVEHGFALGRAAGEEAELLTLAVDPSFQRRGWGQRILSAFEIDAQNLLCSRSFLEVDEQNEAAIALYRSAGYERVGKRKDYYKSSDGSRSSALIMAKDLEI